MTANSDPERLAPRGPDLRAAVELASTNVDADVEFFRSLDFEVERIEPADSPRRAMLVGHGARILLRDRRDATARDGGTLWLESRAADERGEDLTSPGGVRVAKRPARPLDGRLPRSASALPGIEATPVVTPAPEEPSAWQRGRAGMLYRDLIPGRVGGRVIASHIRIPTGGAVADYVHHHDVDFQLIYCRAGWVRVVYEDQGEPFVLRAGDCVLQPPTIRHRVLECSDGLEVVEIGGPADHATFGDPACALPNRTNADRVFPHGQRFHRFVADAGDDAERIDLGLSAPTNGALHAEICRGNDRGGSPESKPRAPGLTLGFVLEADLDLTVGSGPTRRLSRDAAFLIPPGTEFRVDSEGSTARWLRVAIALPRGAGTAPPGQR